MDVKKESSHSLDWKHAEIKSTANYGEKLMAPICDYASWRLSSVESGHGSIFLNIKVPNAWDRFPRPFSICAECKYDYTSLTYNTVIKGEFKVVGIVHENMPDDVYRSGFYFNVPHTGTTNGWIPSSQIQGKIGIRLSTIIIQESDLGVGLVPSLWNEYTKQVRVDFGLKTDLNEKVMIHKAVALTRIPSIAAKNNTNFKQEDNFTVPKCTLNTLKDIVEIVYWNRCLKNVANLLELVSALDYLGFVDLPFSISSNVEEQIRTGLIPLITATELCRKYPNIDKWKQAIYDYIKKHPESLAHVLFK